LRFFHLAITLLGTLCFTGLLTHSIAQDNPSSPAAKSDFDYYLFAMSIAPGFCAQNAERAARKTQCEPRTLRQDFAASPISIHGLWPNRKKGKHPFFCASNSGPSGEKPRRGEHCALPKVENLDAPTQRELKTGMPGIKDCLDRWEWAKHGTCSGLSPDRYFDIQLAWLAKVNKALGAHLLSSAGTEFDIDAWRNQTIRTEPELAQNLQFVCKTAAKRKGEKNRSNTSDSDNLSPPTLLVELKLALHKDGKTILPLSDSRRGQSGCRNGKAFIVQP
jgi:ribonuclease I